MGLLHILPGTLWTVASFVITLGILIFVHEMGHYLAARWRGVFPETFSIGFGPALFSWPDRRGTIWQLSALPLGGYVKLYGLVLPGEAGAPLPAGRRASDSYANASLLSRAIIIAAGPIANFLLAIVLFAGLGVAMGRPVQSTVIGSIVENSAAAHAGLHLGDRLISVAGTPVSNLDQVHDITQAHPGDKVTVTFERGEQTLSVDPVLDSTEKDGKRFGQLGISGIPAYQSLGVAGGLAYGFWQTGDLAREILVGLGRLITGKGSTADLGGVIRIAQISGQVFAQGLGSVVSFIAVLSVNLGLLNLMPIPVLDGGHLVFMAAEAVRGRPLSARVQEYSLGAGLFLIASLMLFSAWNDLSRLGLFHWFGGLTG
jgi:regulator of sigma E protease